MCRNTAPATVSSRNDLIEYWVENAEPVDPNAAPGYAERCIHSEVLKRYPEVNSVIHSHAQDVVPYTISGERSTNEFDGMYMHIVESLINILSRRAIEALLPYGWLSP